MSAYLVPENQINAILSYAKQNIANHWDKDLTIIKNLQDIDKKFHRQAFSGETYAKFSLFENEALQEIGRILWTENQRSVNYRYQEQSKIIPFKFKELNQRNANLFQFLKWCNNLDYQSCERPDWEESTAFRILKQLKQKAISNHPDYESASWGYEERAL